MVHAGPSKSYCNRLSGSLKAYLSCQAIFGRLAFKVCRTRFPLACIVQSRCGGFCTVLPSRLSGEKDMRLNSCIFTSLENHLNMLKIEKCTWIEACRMSCLLFRLVAFSSQRPWPEICYAAGKTCALWRQVAVCFNSGSGAWVGFVLSLGCIWCFWDFAAFLNSALTLSSSLLTSVAVLLAELFVTAVLEILGLCIAAFWRGLSLRFDILACSVSSSLRTLGPIRRRCSLRSSFCSVSSSGILPKARSNGRWWEGSNFCLVQGANLGWKPSNLERLSTWDVMVDFESKHRRHQEVQSCSSLVAPTDGLCPSSWWRVSAWGIGLQERSHSRRSKHRWDVCDWGWRSAVWAQQTSQGVGISEW